MKAKFFFKLLLTIVAVVMVAVSCTDENLPEGKTPIPTPDPDDPTVSAVLNFGSITHDWEYSDGLVADYKKCQAEVTLTKDNVSKKDPINQVLPFDISWEKPQNMVRSTNVFKLEDKLIGDKLLSESKTNNNLLLYTYKQDFTFDFDGFSLNFSTRNQTVKYKIGAINLPNCELDSIVYVEQKREVLERYEVKGEAYLRTKVTFTFDVCRHHTNDNQKHTDKIYPFIIVDAPEKPNPGKDMFNGAIPINGTEKLFLKTRIDPFNSIYTSERDVYEFWSVSGKKRVTYSIDLEVKQWIDEKQEAWKIPHILFGNPKSLPTENTSAAYNKDGKTDYEFEKTTSDWSHTWSYANNYKISTHASAERAWKMYNGLRVIKMPDSKHLQNYVNYTYGDYTQKDINGKTYLSYQSVIFFNGNYNNDSYDLNQNQEFLVEKGSTEPPAPDDPIKSEVILYEYEDINGEFISKIIWRREYKESGTRDSIAVQKLIRSTKIDDNKQFIRENNRLSLKQALDVVTLSEQSKTENVTGHLITTKVIRYGFDFDFFTYNIEESFQTASTVYKGEKLYFIAPTPKVSFNGAPDPIDLGIITGQDGKKYRRTSYILKFKELYDDFMTMITPKVDIDVEDTSVPAVDDIVKWSYKRNRNGLTSNIILHIERRLSGAKDSVLTANFIHSCTMSEKQHFYAPSNEFKLQDVLNPEIEKQTKEIEGISYTTTTTVNKFLYNLYLDKVTTVDQTAKITFQATEIDFLAAETSSVSYSGSTPKDMGVVTGTDGQKYNRTNYTNAYKLTFDSNIENKASQVDIDVKAADPKDEYVSHTITKSFNNGVSKIIFHIIGTLTQRDSVAIQPLAHMVTMEEDKQFYRDNSTLVYQDMGSTQSTQDRRENKNYVQKVTTTNTFMFNVGNSIVKTVHETAYTIYRGEKVEYISPESTIAFAGISDGINMGVVIGLGSKEYNRTKYPLKYKETYDKVESSYSANFNIDVEKKQEVITRTKWEARDKGMQYISGQQWRTYYTLYEEFSDGTNKNTSKETFINVYVTAQSKRILDFGSNEFAFNSLSPGSVSTSNRSGGNNIYIVTYDQPYYGAFTNKDGKSLTSEYHFISEKATYRDGEIEVEFMSADWENITNNGYNAPLSGEVVKNGETYTRYNASFNINGVYNGRNYPASTLVDVDVYKEKDPTIDKPFDKAMTMSKGGLSWSWKREGGKTVAFVTGTLYVNTGIISFWDGGYCYTECNTSEITGRTGNTLYPQGSNYLIPSYITVVKNTVVPSWLYTGIDGISRDEANGALIETIKDVVIDKPFFATPDDNSIFQINGNHVKVVVDGKTIFDEYFAK